MRDFFQSIKIYEKMASNYHQDSRYSEIQNYVPQHRVHLQKPVHHHPTWGLASVSSPLEGLEAQQMDWCPTLPQSEVRNSKFFRSWHSEGTSINGPREIVPDQPHRNVLPISQQTFGGNGESNIVRISPKRFLRNISISPNTAPTAYQRGLTTQMTYQDLQCRLYDRYEFNFHPVVCGLMIHLNRPKSQDASEQTISFEEYKKLWPFFDKWIEKFREFAIVICGKDYIEGKTVAFSTAFQKGFLILTRLQQALLSVGFKVAEGFVKFAFETFKEKEQGALSINGFIAIILLHARFYMLYRARTDMTFRDLQRKLNDLYKYTFQPLVCIQMIHYIHGTSQDVANSMQTISLVEYEKLLPILYKSIAKFHEFAFVKKDDGDYVEGVSIDFTTAIQHGVLNLDRLKQAFESMNSHMADHVAEQVYEKFKEEKKGAVSLNGFISICLMYCGSLC